jgi:ligand-binding sensor domain-containing protein
MGLFAIFVAVIYLSAAVKLATGRVGWSSLTSAGSSLPDDMVTALLPLEDGRMLIGTNSGVAFYTPPVEADGEAQWVIVDQENSGLMNSEVLSLAVDTSGAYWFGTSSGLSRYDGSGWTSYRASDLALPGARILSLVADEEGHIFAGTLEGASFFDGTVWTPIDQAENRAVFSMVVQDGVLWMAVADGVWEIHLSEDLSAFHPTIATVNCLMFDSAGTLWAATSGNGLAFWQAGEWHYYTTSTSGIPYNTVNWVAEVEPGILWVATSRPYGAGGNPASFDGEDWHTFLSNNSGASNSEPLVIADSPDGFVWIGTRSSGIDLYKLGR